MTDTGFCNSADLLPLIKTYKQDNIYINFNDIEFISRSAAHELLKTKEKYKNIQFKNLNSEVSGILRIVAANIACPKDTSKKFKPEKTTFSALLGY